MPRTISRFLLAINLSLWIHCAAWSEPPAAPVKPALTDRFGDPLPAGAVARLGSVRFQQGGWVNALTFSRDGKRLFSAGWDLQVRLWDTATGKELRHFTGFYGGIDGTALSVDEKYLAATGSARWMSKDPTVRIWETATGKPVPWMAKHVGQPTALVFTPDGKALITAEEKGILRLWAFPSGKKLREFTALEREYLGVFRLAFSPDSKFALSGSMYGKRDKICLWRVATGELVRVVDGKQEFRSLAVNSDTTMAASTAEDGLITVWDTATGKKVRQFKCPGGTRLGLPLAISPDKRTLVSGGSDGIVRLWDVATGKELHRMTGHNAPLRAMAFSADGKTVASGGQDQRIRLWDVATGREKRQPEEGHRNILFALAFSPDGRLLASGGFDKVVCLWDVPGRKLLRRLEGHPIMIGTLAFSPDGKLLASAGAGVHLWDVATGKQLRHFPSPAPGAASVAFSLDGKRLVIGWHQDTIQLVDVATGKSIRVIRTSLGTSNRVLLSADGETVIATGHGTVLAAWSVATGAEVYHAPYSSGFGYEMTFSPDGRNAVAQLTNPTYREICLWELATGKQRALLPAKEQVWASAVSPDGTRMAGALNSSPLAVWDLPTGREIARLPGHSFLARSLAFSPDGRTLASGGSDGTVLLWDMTRLPAPKPPVRRALSPEKLDAAWQALLGADATRAFQALWALRAVPDQALPLLRRHLRPAAPDQKLIARLVADLDSEDFAEREKATAELAKLGSSAVEPLRDALKAARSAEVRRRLKEMLDKCQATLYPPERLRAARMLELLERLGTADAREFLKTLAANKTDRWLACEAQAAESRLRRLEGK